MTARAVLLVGLFLIILTVLRHWGEKPRLAVEPTAAHVAKAQAPVCTAPWSGTLKKKVVVV